MAEKFLGSWQKYLYLSSHPRRARSIRIVDSLFMFELLFKFLFKLLGFFPILLYLFAKNLVVKIDKGSNWECDKTDGGEEDHAPKVDFCIVLSD